MIGAVCWQRDRYHFRPRRFFFACDSTKLVQYLVFSLKVLADDEKRKIYDKHGEDGLKNMHHGGGDPFDPFSRYSVSYKEILIC